MSEPPRDNHLRRVSKPKVRTGCNNCRRRRLKCDESRPSCRVCQETGLTCDGYPSYERHLPAKPLVSGREIISGRELPSGVWQCIDCGREVNSQVFGDQCPDCNAVNPHEKENAAANTQASTPQVVIHALEIDSGLETIPETVLSNETQLSHITPIGIASQARGKEGGNKSQWRLCYILICIGLFTFSGSLALALWWSMTRKDVSGGFTMASYIVAVGGLPLAAIQIRHNQRCNCWKRSQDGFGERDLDTS